MTYSERQVVIYMRIPNQRVRGGKRVPQTAIYVRALKEPWHRIEYGGSVHDVMSHYLRAPYPGEVPSA